MAVRFCPVCAREVEVVEGVCALGHETLGAVPETLDGVRREVDKVFEEAEVGFVTALHSAGVAVEGRPAPAYYNPTAVPPPIEPQMPPQTTIAPTVPVTLPPAPPAPRMAPPPPPPPRIQPHGVWDPLENPPATIAHDPIQAFAPPPRMDWGPRKATLMERLKARKTA